MRIDTRDLTQDKDFQVSGQEPWLKDLYDGVPHASPLKAQGTVSKLDEDGFLVTFSLEFEPLVTCSRCSEIYSTPFTYQGEAIYRPADYEKPRDYVLKKEDFERYELQGYEINLEELLNDAVHTQKPDHDFQRHVCTLKAAANKPLFSTHEPESLSPFAKLKNLIPPNAPEPSSSKK